MHLPIHLLGRRGSIYRLAVVACTFSAALLQTKAQVITDQNSTASIQPNTQAGMFSWTVDGVNQLSKQWFWYAMGPRGASSPPASIDTLTLAGFKEYNYQNGKWAADGPVDRSHQGHPKVSVHKNLTLLFGALSGSLAL